MQRARLKRDQTRRERMIDTPTNLCCFMNHDHCRGRLGVLAMLKSTRNVLVFRIVWHEDQMKIMKMLKDVNDNT